MNLKSASIESGLHHLQRFDPIPDLSIRHISQNLFYPFQDAIEFLFYQSLLQFGFRDKQAATLTEKIIDRLREVCGTSEITRKNILLKKSVLLKEQAVIEEGGKHISFFSTNKAVNQTKELIFVSVATGRMLVSLAESWDVIGGKQNG